MQRLARRASTPRDAPQSRDRRERCFRVPRVPPAKPYNILMRNFAGMALSSVLLLGSAIAADVWLKDDSLVSSVEKKVHELQPTREERRFDQIGWAPSILAAEARARETRRPVFLFTYDGKIETGRC